MTHLLLCTASGNCVLQRSQWEYKSRMETSAARLILQKHLHELVIVQFPVSIHIGFLHEVVDLLLGQGLAQHRGHLLQLLGADISVFVTVEYLESFPDGVSIV